MEKKKPKFLRRTSKLHSKLGKKRKKKQIWRKPTGRHNKMREKRKSVPVVVSIGYRGDKKVRGLVREKTPIMVYNLKDFGKAGKNSIIIIGKVGSKKRAEIIKTATGKKIEIQNLNKLKNKK